MAVVDTVAAEDVCGKCDSIISCVFGRTYCKSSKVELDG